MQYFTSFLSEDFKVNKTIPYDLKMCLEISQNLQENTCARVFSLIKLPKACNFIKKETQAQVFPVNFPKFLRTSFL